MEATTQELIMLAEPICEKIRIAFYSDLPWIKCYKDLSIKFSLLKSIAKKCFSDKTDKEILMELRKYCVKDIQDVLYDEGFYSLRQKKANEAQHMRAPLTIEFNTDKEAERLQTLNDANTQHYRLQENTNCLRSETKKDDHLLIY